MSNRLQDEELPYRSAVASMVPPARQNTIDEANYDTLRIVRDSLREKLDDIDKWHAFDAEEKELTLKQQIVAHRVAYEMVAPTFDAIDSVISLIDSKYKQG